MGLDMYLTKKTFVGANFNHRKITGIIELKQDGEPIPIKLERVSKIVEAVGYWSKANHIHKWFVENIQSGKDNCGEYYVPEEKMEELLLICKKIKKESILIDGAVINGYTYTEDGQEIPIVEEGKEIKNPEVAEKLLPTAKGFFFGSTDYDQYYMNDIDNTIEILEAALKEEGEFYYQSSW